MNKKIFSTFLLFLIIIDSVPCKKLLSFATYDTVATITKDNEKELLDAVSKLNKSAGIVYINTPVINISSKTTILLSGSVAGGIVGKKQSNGEYPRIDFKKARNSGSTARGFTITGSNQFIQYLIIENAGDNGIWIGGSKNIIDHVITRYNNDTGIQLSSGAKSNRLNYCYSYRNVDVPTYGGNADGFAPKLGASDTIFNYCFAWDNSDDGWDSYDYEGDTSESVSYLHSACWNNGNPDVFTGKYDYVNGKSLDKNLWTIQQLIASDSNFESNYKNKKFNINNGKINGMKATDWINKAQTEMNGNGFKFGSKYTKQSPDIKRVADYSIAFDHKVKGFDNNSSKKCTGYISNCVAFNNLINYQLPYTFAKWSNNWSWNAKNTDQYLQNQTLKTPKDKNNAIKQVYLIRDAIIKNCAHNTFNDKINFDNVIKSLV